MRPASRVRDPDSVSEITRFASLYESIDGIGHPLFCFYTNYFENFFQAFLLYFAFLFVG